MGVELEPATDEDLEQWERHCVGVRGGRTYWQLGPAEVERLIARIRQEQARADGNLEQSSKHLRRAEAAEAKVEQLGAELSRVNDIILSSDSFIAWREMEKAKAERDQLAAQVAALSRFANDEADDGTCRDCGRDIYKGTEPHRSTCTFATLPAAAARYLAADKVAQAWGQYVEVHADENSHRESIREFWGYAMAALDEYRRTCGQPAAPAEAPNGHA